MTTANILPPIAVLGGDKRQIGAAKFLAELGFQVSAWGIGSASDFSPHIRCFRDWREAVRSAEVLLLPLPATVDGVRLSSPLSAEGEEIRLDNEPSVFSLIGQIQEETHRYAISYQKKLRTKHLRYSELDDIPGIGATRKQQLLRQFKSLAAIRQASLEELKRILPNNAALAVYSHFLKKEEET